MYASSRDRVLKGVFGYERLDAAIDEGVGSVSFFWGLDRGRVKRAKDAGLLVMQIGAYLVPAVGTRDAALEARVHVDVLELRHAPTEDDAFRFEPRLRAREIRRLVDDRVRIADLQVQLVVGRCSLEADADQVSCIPPHPTDSPDVDLVCQP